MKRVLQQLSFAFFFVIISCSETGEKPMSEQDVRNTISEIESKFAEMYHQNSLLYFEATMSGKDEDYDKYSKAEMQLNEYLSNKETFEKIKSIKENFKSENDTINRAILLLYNSFLAKQNDPELLNEISALSTQIEKKFSTFRAKIGEKQLTDNEIEQMLKNETNSDKLKEAWLAHKEIGKVVSEDVLKLVRLRNKAAQELGFENFHTMSLTLSEQDPKELEQFFDELDALTAAGFAELKDEINDFFSTRFKISKEEIMPWHHQNRYFQEAPELYGLNMDQFFKDVDIAETTVKYFASVGSPIEDMMEKSDLYEREGKYQHAYCIDVNRDTKDVRVVCNITPTHRWMETNMHEFGHAVYFKYHDSQLPWVLRTPSHIFTTEGIAMLYGRKATSADYLINVAGIPAEQVLPHAETMKKMMRLQQLVFSRWAQVVYRFEKAMYADPEQDLNTLWKSLVEKYQLMKMPEGRNEPDWATKIHIATYPCYYHNYLLGEIFASQFYAFINERVLNNPEGSDNSFFARPESATFLIEQIYKPGALYHWKDLIKKATGEEFTPKYYAKQFVN